MCNSFYCTGFDGYGYLGFGRNPWLNSMYSNLYSLNSLVNSFRGGRSNRGSNCCCSNGNSGNNGSGGCSGDLGSLLNGTGGSSSSIGDSLPMPGSNVPPFKIAELPEYPAVTPYQPPVYTCDDITPGYSGILTPDLSTIGAMPPVANPLLALLLGGGLCGMDPCDVAQLLNSGVLPGTSTLTSSTPVNSTPTSSTPTNSTPVNSTPTSSTPTNSTPVNSTPTTSTPTNSTPVNSTPSSSTPSSSAPTNAVSFSGNGVVTLGADIVSRVNQVAQGIKCNPADLMGVIYKESSWRTVPRNWDGRSAVGLIQWTQTSIDDLNQHCGTNGLTKADIAQMDMLQQLDLAEITLRRAKTIAGFDPNHQLTAGELYALVYAPGNASKEEIARRGDSLYSGNEGLDINRDGTITKSELAQRTNDGSRFVATA